jgi:UDP-GlcNAc:undecaprenyl-phosphate GlcNAc-1-phosphate transferase
MKTSWLYFYLIVSVISALITYLITFLTRAVSRPLKIIDNPGLLKIHTEPTPRLGGIGIYIGFAATVALVLWKTAEWPQVDSVNNTIAQFQSILMGSCVVMLIGIYDDVRSSTSEGISAVVKLIILFGATFILAHAGIIINFPFPKWVNFALTLFWVVGVISAFNAMDNMDGLAAGLALIAAGTYMVVARQTHQWVWGILAAALVGATAGFLPHNFRVKKPAAIFMGDSGAFFIGFTLAALSIMGGWSTSPFKAGLIPIIILGVPLLDFIYIVIFRYLKGLTPTIRQIITYTGNDHLSHRINHFMGKKQTVLFIYLVSFTLGLGAVALRNSTKTEAIFITIQYLLIFSIILILTGFLSRHKIQ